MIQKLNFANIFQVNWHLNLFLLLVITSTIQYLRTLISYVIETHWRTYTCIAHVKNCCVYSIKLGNKISFTNVHTCMHSLPVNLGLWVRMWNLSYSPKNLMMGQHLLCHFLSWTSPSHITCHIVVNKYQWQMGSGL